MLRQTRLELGWGWGFSEVRSPSRNAHSPPAPLLFGRRYLDGQPLQFMLKDRRRGAYLYRWHMWHEALLTDAERHEAQRAQRA